MAFCFLWKFLKGTLHDVTLEDYRPFSNVPRVFLSKQISQCNVWCQILRMHQRKKNIKLERTSKQLISTLYDNNVDAVRHESVYLSEYVKKSLSIYNLYMHDEENNFYNIVLNKLSFIDFINSYGSL